MIFDEKIVLIFICTNFEGPFKMFSKMAKIQGISKMANHKQLSNN